MSQKINQLFDEYLEIILLELPGFVQRYLDEIAVVVEDEPPLSLLRELGISPRNADLCGLHWGIPLTRRSVEHSGVLPDQIRLFRGPIKRLAREEGQGTFHQRLYEQIRVTLLHEIGHHVGMTEEDLRELGYG